MSAGGLLDMWHDERLDQTETFGYTITLDNPKADLVVLDAIEQWRDHKFRVSTISDERDGTEIVRVVECEALWYDLNNTTRGGATVLSEVSPSSGLATLLDGTGWTTGVRTTTSSTLYSLEGTDLTVLALLRRWAKITGTYLRFDTVGRTVDLATAQGRDLGLTVRYRRNLVRMERRQEAPQCTVLYPYGADGLTIAGVNSGDPFIEDFSYYTGQGLTTNQARALYTKSRVWSDTSFLKDSDLLAAAQAKIAKLAQPIISYECSVVDLTDQTGFDESVMAVGDSVRVTDPELDIDLDATIVRIKRYPLEPWRNTVELAFQPDLVDDGSDSTRGDVAEEWRQFIGPIAGNYQIRNDGRYITNRIPLRFRAGGKAHFHVDLRATGVGAGTLHVDVYDNEAAAVVFRAIDVPYANGVETQASISFAAEGLDGSYDFRVRVSTVASGGPLPTLGVNVSADPTVTASFWIMAQGAVQETPTAENSQLFSYNGDKAGGNGSTQLFTVPDNVTEIAVTMAGSKARGVSGAAGGFGTTIRFKLTVVPGTIYDIDVGGHNTAANTTHIGGWGAAIGGNGAGGTGATGQGGGGATGIRAHSASFAASIAVVPGGGGATGNSGSTNGAGGNSGFYQGANGTLGGGITREQGYGATQFAAGAGGVAGGPAEAGDVDGSGYGGDAIPDTVGGGTTGSGGGGAGWHGGGGGSGLYAGAGGAAGYVDLTQVFDLEISDADNDADGYLLVEWDDPLT